MVYTILTCKKKITAICGFHFAQKNYIVLYMLYSGICVAMITFTLKTYSLDVFFVFVLT